LPAPSNAPDGDESPQRFQVTHPFHPLHGREFALVTCRHNWGEDRAYFYDDNGRLVSIPAAWTSISPADPFVRVAAGRCPFRVLDLLELARLLEMLTEGEAP
jgi:YD repeat-containing protein